MSRYVDVDYNLHDLPCYYDFSDEELIAISTVLKLIPTADVVEINRGYWKGKPIAGNCTVRCSVCGSAFLENDGKWNYCPNCGAKMEG